MIIKYKGYKIETAEQFYGLILYVNDLNPFLIELEKKKEYINHLEKVFKVINNLEKENYKKCEDTIKETLQRLEIIVTSSIRSNTGLKVLLNIWIQKIQTVYMKTLYN